MAVPSTGQLSLFGIAMEMVHADYQEPEPVPSNSSPTDRGDHEVYNNLPGSNYFYSPHATIQRTPSSPAPNIDFDSSEYASQNYESNTNSIADISLTGMSGASQTTVPSTIGGGAGTLRTTMGHHNSTFPVSLTHKSPNYVTTKAHSALYDDGPTNFGGMSTHPVPVYTATIMYTMFIGDSETPTNSDNHGFAALVFGYNPSIFSGGNGISVHGPTKGDFWGSPPQPAPGAEPANFEGIPFYHPQPNTINSTSPSYPNYPSTVGDVAMSNFYNYDHDFVAPTPNGINMSGTALFTGNQGTSLQTYNVDFSSPTHLGTTTIGNPSTSIYYIVAYKNGVTPPSTSPFQGDIQLTNFQSYGPPSPFGATYNSNPSNSRTSVSSPPSPTPLNINPLTPSTTAGPVVTSYAPKLTTPVNSPGANTTGGRWNHRPSGKPPSSNTGVTDPTGYFYTETSGPSTARTGQWFILVNPIGKTGSSLTSDTMQFKFYANGGNVGSCFVGLWVNYPNT